MSAPRFTFGGYPIVMNKRLLLSFCFFVIAVTCFSQNTTSIAAGLNYNDFRYGDIPDGFSGYLGKPSIGFHAGIFREFELGQTTRLLAGVQYSRKGNKGDVFTGNIILNYVELPVLFSWSPARRVSIDAGPTFGFNVSAYSKPGNKKNKFEVKAVELGLNGGASFEVFDRFYIYARYSYGLTPFDHLEFRDSNNVIYHRSPSFNTAIQFGLRYVVSRQK